MWNSQMRKAFKLLILLSYEERGPKYETGVWCPGAESNHRHCDFQSHALPTELPGRRGPPKGRAKQSARFIEAGFPPVQTSCSAVGKRSKPAFRRAVTPQ